MEILVIHQHSQCLLSWNAQSAKKILKPICGDAWNQLYNLTTEA
jgi:hypothetical protein